MIVVLPLFPAGSLADLATRYVLKWVYKTINRKVLPPSAFPRIFFSVPGLLPLTFAQKDSMLKTLETEFPDVDISQYISFFHLRTHAALRYALPSSAHESPSLHPSSCSNSLLLHLSVPQHLSDGRSAGGGG